MLSLCAFCVSDSFVWHLQGVGQLEPCLLYPLLVAGIGYSAVVQAFFIALLNGEHGQKYKIID